MTYPRLKPVHEFDDVLVMEALKKVEFIVHHALITLDILLQDDLDSHLALRGVGLADDAVGTGTQGPAELVLAPSETKLVSGRLGHKTTHMDAQAAHITNFLS